SCSEVRNSAYFQELKSKKDSLNLQRNYVGLYEARIKPKDLLAITVVSTELEASRIYNLVTPQTAGSVDKGSVYSQPMLQNYLVDNYGNINFPVFGKIEVIGLTRKELESKLQKMLSSAFTKEMPIITIRINNYSVSILGEVVRPGKFETSNERITILEGLALAGDMTIYGRRDNVKVLREDVNGTKKYYTLNLRDKNIIYSPAYFLEQNDIVYVEPNKSRTKSANYGSAESYRITAYSLFITLTSLMVTLYTAYKLK
ncbi:MAG: polysaccharide biosynthesis/export family protein, partial [Paludibacter sp.]